MSRYASIDDTRKVQLTFSYVMVGLLSLGCLGLGYGWYKSPENLKIDIPPNLRHGAIVKPGDYYAATVEAFATMIFRDVNRWYQNGYKDYGQNIFDNQAYLTPRYREWLLKDMEQKAKAGELKDRVRFMLETESSGNSELNVEGFDDGSWLVHLKLVVVERIAGTEVKRVGVHYPIRVVRLNISPKKNAWGLALDGYPEGMQEKRIDAKAKNDV